MSLAYVVFRSFPSYLTGQCKISIKKKADFRYWLVNIHGEVDDVNEGNGWCYAISSLMSSKIEENSIKMTLGYTHTPKPFHSSPISSLEYHIFSATLPVSLFVVAVAVRMTNVAYTIHL